MKNLIIPQNPQEKFIPSVFFDAETGNLEISGESFMESPDQFYFPLVKWIEEYVNEINNPIKLVLKLTYYNTSSSKYILEILKRLRKYQDNDGKVEVVWYYSREDEDIEDEIDEFSRESGVAIDPICI